MITSENKFEKYEGLIWIERDQGVFILTLPSWM